MSINEVNKYFSSDAARMCAPTAYAKSQGAYTNDNYTVGGKATCGWWLRSPGSYQNNAAGVYVEGGVYGDGNYFGNDTGCVRPALWINLE